MVKLYGFCLRIAYIVHQRHPYIESLLTLIILGATSNFLMTDKIETMKGEISDIHE